MRSSTGTKQSGTRTQSRVFTVLSVLFLLIGFAIITTPFVMRAISEYQQNATVQQTQREVDGWPYPQAENQLKTAREYNKKLAAGGQAAIGEVKDPFAGNAGQSTTSGADDSMAAKDQEYQSLLDAGQGPLSK